MQGTIGLVAGNHQFPLIFAKAARQNGYKVFAVALVGETVPEIEGLVEETLWVKIGQLQKTIDFFKERGVTEAAMAGGLTKENMFVNFEPDERALAIVARLTQLNDDVVLRAMADEFTAEGIAIRPSTLYTPELLAPEGVLTRRQPTEQEMTDVGFGWNIAKKLGELDTAKAWSVAWGSAK